MPTLSFLILTYNSEKHIELLLDSLLSCLGEKIKSGEYEIVIADNDSSDNTHTIVEKYISGNINFFKTGSNAGYAKGINIASKHAKGKYLVVLNPDTRLVEADFDRVIEEFEKNKNLAIAGMNLENEQGIREKTAGKFYNFLTFALFSMGLEEVFGLRFAPGKKRKVDFVSGGFVIFRKDIFEKLSGYDEDYFMYVEDIDICYRAKKLGFDVYFLPYAKAIHKGQGSSSREFAIVNIYKGLVTFYKKHGSFLEEQYVRNLLSMKAALIIFLGSILGKKNLASIYMKALKEIS